jgi:hypothetical protein
MYCKLLSDAVPAKVTRYFIMINNIVQDLKGNVVFYLKVIFGYFSGLTEEIHSKLNHDAIELFHCSLLYSFRNLFEQSYSVSKYEASCLTRKCAGYKMEKFLSLYKAMCFSVYRPL